MEDECRFDEQISVFVEQIFVHGFVGGVERVDVGLVQRRTRKFHLLTRTERFDDEATFAHEIMRLHTSILIR